MHGSNEFPVDKETARRIVMVRGDSKYFHFNNVLRARFGAFSTAVQAEPATAA